MIQIDGDAEWLADLRDYSRDYPSVEGVDYIVLSKTDCSILRALERDPAKLKRRSDAIRAAYASPEMKAMCSRRSTGMLKNETVKAKHSKSAKKYCQSPEGRAQRSASNIIAWADPVKAAVRVEKIRTTLAKKKAAKLQKENAT